ncbi:MAG: ComEC family competence protein [Cyclobacteriaceae bacterium]|nr:ComEC family competence protein [Cyclobacteriaceae bacterium]
MQKWVPYAMVRITLCLVAGILLGIYQPNILNLTSAKILLVLLIGLAFALYLLTLKSKSLNPVFGVVVWLALTATGFVLVHQRTLRNQPDNIIHFNNISAYEAVVRSAPESKANSWKLYVEVKRVKTDTWQAASGKVVLYVSKKTIDKIPWRYGDRVLIQGTPHEVAPPANPNEFNYKRFLTFKNVYHQQFLKARQVHLVTTPPHKSLPYYAHRVRAWASSVISGNIKNERAQAVAMALILGITEEIDNDLLQAYAASGAMHVLAVSGLHVGVIYALILLALKPLKHYRWSAWLIAAISIGLLWSFAFVTGLSPSVLRAVTMFSLVALARPLGWRTNIYNTLAASAFVLLWFDPYLIMSVGFQLSYLAVLGIVYLQRPIYNLWVVDSWLGDWVWKITTVSIAAQVATFALGMLYFHQFPVYFLISNLFVIPLSIGILVGGIGLLACSALATGVAHGVGAVVEFLINILNTIVATTESLPFSLISNIYLTTTQCWLLMLFVGSLILLFHFRATRWLWLTGIVVTAFVATQVHHYQTYQASRQFVVYSISNHSAVEWITRGKSYFRADSVLLQDFERTRFHILPNRLQLGVTTTTTEVPFQRAGIGILFYQWAEKRIAVVEKRQSLQVSLPADYLIISHNALSLKDTSQLRFVSQIILDGTNSSQYIGRWKAAQQNKPWQVHATPHDGAFIIRDN